MFFACKPMIYLIFKNDASFFSKLFSCLTEYHWDCEITPLKGINVKQETSIPEMRYKIEEQQWKKSNKLIGSGSRYRSELWKRHSIQKSILLWLWYRWWMIHCLIINWIIYYHYFYMSLLTKAIPLVHFS